MGSFVFQNVPLFHIARRFTCAISGSFDRFARKNPLTIQPDTVIFYEHMLIIKLFFC